MRAASLSVWGLGLLLLLEGCHLLLGDFTADRPDEVESEGCTDGAVRCVGNVLQRCNGETDTWDNEAVCASENLCDVSQNTCLPPVCAAGERRCLEAELQICNGTRDGWLTITSCATAGHCSAQAGTCTEVPCEPRETQCNGALLQSCRDDQSGWDDLATCASAALCNAVDGMCDEPVCQIGEFHCEGAQLQTCADGLDGWNTIGICHTDALCDESMGTCSAGVCTRPGAFRCSDTGVLERCADDLASWIPEADCKSEAHCDAVNGTCTECTPGQYQCSGPTLQQCNSDSTAWIPVDTCETDGLCLLTLSAELTTCEPPRCDADEYSCDGEQPLICSADRTEFRENGAACVTAELCNSQLGTCSPPTCNPGDTRCTDAQPEICNPGRTGYVPNGEACESDALCNPGSGTCGDAACLSNQTRCDPLAPTHLQRCTSDLSGWDSCDTCATPGLCSASVNATTCDETSCEEPTCSLTDRWCGGTGSRTLYQCPSSLISSQALVLDVCETAGLCELARSQGTDTCPEPSCALTDRWCGGTDGATLYQCPASRINTQAIVLDVCATAGLCAQAHSQGAATCPEPTCALTDKWCGGTGNRTFYQCPASRINTEAVVLGVCATNELCEVAHSQDSTTCPAPACAAGQTRCGGANDSTLQMCNGGRTDFVDCDTCDSSELCTDSLSTTTCNTSACHACLADQKRCSGSELQVCNATQTGWSDLETCDSQTLCTNSLTPSAQTTCDVCVDGTPSCDGPQPQVCDDPDTGPAVWVDSGAECDAADLCDEAAGTCICSLEETRCNPDSGNIDTCESTGWVESEVCADGCDGDGCIIL